MAGNSGNIILKPRLRASVEALSGIIIGSIVPIEVQTEITATNGTDTISSFANADGNFMLVGLPEGSYTITITPDIDSGLAEQVIENVEVTVGNSTDLGEIILN
jgi:predicted HTH transcriptional regulator